MMDYDLGYYGVFARWVKCAIMIMLLVLYTDHPVGIVSEASKDTIIVVSPGKSSL